MRGSPPLLLSFITWLTMLAGAARLATAARQCYEPCCEKDPATDQLNGVIVEGAEAYCCMEAAGCFKGSYSGTVPYCFMEDMRCIAAMRKEPLEVYMWGLVSAHKLHCG